MKKFLSSLLIVFVTIFVAPAYADDACKNLFNINNMAKSSYAPEQMVSGDSITLGGNNSATFYYFTNYFIPAGTYTIKYTTASSAPYMIAGYNGNDAIFTIDGAKITAHSTIKQILSTSYGGFKATGKTARIQSNVPFKIGFAPSAQITLTNIQLESGTTATSYVPYNPLCATCDGTIVNYTTVTENDVPAGVQNGTPSPTNPIEPTFYQQGNMILRKVGDYADSYDAATGKITRRVGVKILDGTEIIDYYNATQYPGIFNVQVQNKLHNVAGLPISSHFNKVNQTGIKNIPVGSIGASVTQGNNVVWINVSNLIPNGTDGFNAWLAEQYAAGTPVTVYYPLATPVEETPEQSTYCEPTIKIATTAYNAARFNSVQTDLNNAVATIRDIVTNTINQTAAIASLQADKQTRPEDACPAGKKCLLVETEENGVIVPHWFPIIEAPE